MAKRENHAVNPDIGDKPPDQILNSILQELESLHENIKGQLSEDITRLQEERSRLIEDVQKLRLQSEQLHSQQLEYLSQKTLSQQQLWLKQLAQVLAHNLQDQLIQQMRQVSANSQYSGAIPGGEFPLATPSNPTNQQTSELLTSLETTVRRTFQNLQQDINNYRSDLSQQLVNMQDLERQGEAILENLVSRIRQAVQSEANAYWEDQDSNQSWENQQSGGRPSPTLPGPQDTLPPGISYQDGSEGDDSEPSGFYDVSDPEVITPETPIQEEPKPLPPPPPKPVSQVRLGLTMALLSAIVLSVFNVSLKILIRGKEPRLILGLFPVEGVVTPGFGNSLLILLFRMIVVMALMPILATFLYPSVWSDLRRFFESGGKGLWGKVIGSAAFLFLSQVLIYVAIGNIPTGIAITIFFIYPIITVLGAWALFGDKPTLIRALAIGGIMAGLIMAGAPSFGKKAFGDVNLGIMSAMGSGITFAGYVLLTQMAAGKLHPIPFSLVNFAVIFILASLSLWIPWPAGLAPNIDPSVWSGLLIGGLILGVLTLFSYLLNNIAIRFAGAALASVIGTLGPALTALFAFFLIGEKVEFVQIMGMVVVTLSVGAMSWERVMAGKKKA